VKSIAQRLVNYLPYVGRLRKQAVDAGMYPPGHFYSPIPTRADVLTALRFHTFDAPEISLNKEKQLERLRTFAQYYRELPFTNTAANGLRYHYDQTVFSFADAIFLYSFLRQHRPRRVIEVGSGFSSAVMLDTRELFLDRATEMTFIEPYPTKLRRLLKPGDDSRATIFEKKVQDIPVSLFTSLGPGDLLFIDSSHVVKAGSDVQFLMFEVVPHLRPGVFVHFHDIFYSFEYPDQWLLKGSYWNEAYFLRAFLAYNSEWEIYFFNNYVGDMFRDFLTEHMPLCLKNTGGSLYLRRVTKSDNTN